MLFIYLIILINAVIYYLINTGKVDPSDYSLSYYGVSVRKEYYRLVTGAFMHQNTVHLIMNMISLYNIGSVLVGFLGSFTVLIVYFVSIIVGHIFTINMRHSNNDDYTSSIGASGGICGLIGVYLVLIFSITGGMAINSILRSLFSIGLISLVPGVDGKSHISCLAVGIVIGFVMFYVLGI